MKKSKLFILAGLISATISFISCGLSYQNADLYTAGCPTVDAASITSLDVNWLSENVTIVTSTVTTQITATETSDIPLTEETTMHYYIADGVLHIQEYKNGFSNFNLPKKSITITVPAYKTFEKINVNVTSALVSASNISATTFDCNFTSGNLSLTGSITNIITNSTSGTVTFSGTSTSVSANSTSGNSNFTFYNYPTSISSNVTSGTTTLNLPSNSLFECTCDTVSGTFNTNFIVTKNGNRYISNGNSLRISIQFNSTSGNFYIYKNI